jgi:hypothetical protein
MPMAPSTRGGANAKVKGERLSGHQPPSDKRQNNKVRRLHALMRVPSQAWLRQNRELLSAVSLIYVM